MFESSAEAILQYQVSLLNSEVSALASHCFQRTGEALAYMGMSTNTRYLSSITQSTHAGTEAVVKDMDHVSRLIDGEDGLVNCAY